MSKFLQIFVNTSKNKEGLLNRFGNPVGGTEKVTMECHERLLENGHDSYIVDSHESPYEGEGVIKFYSAEEKTARINQRLVDLCADFDYIVLHSNYTLPKYLNRAGIVYTHVDHMMLTPVNKLYYGSFFAETWVHAKKLGSRFITVSEYARDWKETQYRKFNPEFKFDEYFKFQFVTEELSKVDVKASEGYGIQIARPTKEKALNRFAKVGGDYKIISIGDPKEAESCDRVADHILWNVPRENTMDLLSRASFLFATSAVESAGIAPLEALCAGVPVVVYDTGKGHASYMMAPEGAEYICSHEDKDRIESFRTLTVHQRRAISREVREYNSSEVQFRELLKMIKSVKNEPFSNLLEFMQS